MLFRLLFTILLLAAGPLWAQSCQSFGWDQFLMPGPQDYEVVENIALKDDRYMSVVTFGALKDPYAKVFLFMEFTEDCPTRAISLGSYAQTNLMNTDSSDRIYHLDLYDGDAHTTMGFFSDVPELDVLKQQAISTFNSTEN